MLNFMANCRQFWCFIWAWKSHLKYKVLKIGQNNSDTKWTFSPETMQSTQFKCIIKREANHTENAILYAFRAQCGR